MKKTFLALVMLLIASTVWSQSTTEVEGIFYEVIEGSANARVTGNSGASGDIAIQSTVTIEGSDYTVTEIGEGAFVENFNLTSVEIPNSVTSIGDYAFSNCSGMVSVIIGNSVNSIGSGAFTKCSSLKSVEIPNSVNSIGDYAFSCSGLTSVEIPNSVTSIGDYAFHECSGMVSVIIGNSVNSIGNEAFNYCDNLTNITVKATTPPNLGDGTFYRYDAMVAVPLESLSAYQANEQWSQFPSISNPDYSYTDENGIKYEVIEGTDNARVTGNNGASGDIAILGAVTILGSNYTVTEIGENAFNNCEGLTSVEIPNSVTRIGAGAFSWCGNLNSVTIPSSVISIGGDAFSWCSNLSSVEIPNSVTSIGAGAFRYSGLKSITIPKSVTSIGNGIVGYSPITEINVESGNAVYDSRENCNAIIETATNKLVQGCYNTVIPNTVIILGIGAFNGFGMPSIAIPNSVISIEERAFSDCTNLTSVKIPNSVKTIGDYAFSSSYTMFTSIEIGSSVESIGSCAFSCNTETKMKVNATVPPVLGENPFSCYGFTVEVPAESITAYKTAEEWSKFNIVGPRVEHNGIIYDLKEGNIAVVVSSNADNLPAEVVLGPTVVFDEKSYSVTEISNDAFAGCEGITSIVVNESVASIGSGVFEGCSSLTEVTWNATNCSYMDYVAILPSSVKKVNIGDNVTSIPGYLCYGLESLETIEFPEGLQSIGAWSFAYTGLNAINIPDGVTGIGGGAFSGCESIQSIEIPESVETIGSGVFEGCSSLTEVTWNATNCSYMDYVAILPSSVKKVNIGDNVTSIPGYLCYGLESLESVELPSGLEVIGSNAFSYSGLKSIYIPETVTTIGTRSFAYCESIQAIEIPENVTSFNTLSLDGCTALKEVVWNAKNVTVRARISLPASITSFKFGENVEVIPAGLCKSLTGLTEIVIPNSVTEIGEQAFSGCTYLKKVVIGTGLKTINAEVFASCDRLEEVIVKATTAPEIVNSNAFTSDAYTFGTLHVNYGYKDYYAKELYWRNFKNVTEESSPNHFEVSQSSMIASRGGKFSIPLQLINVNEIGGFQADIYLPSGFIVEEDDNGEYEIILSGRATPSHGLSYNVMSDGALRVVAYSVGANAFDGNDGVVMNVNIKIAENFNGSSTVEIKNVKMTDINNTEYNGSDLEFTVTVSDPSQGDVNGTGSVNITDVMETAYYIVKSGITPINLMNADVNQDNDVNVIDVVGITNIVVGTNITPATLSAIKRNYELQSVETGNVIEVEGFNILPGEEKEVSVCLNNSDAFTAFQADIYLPAGLKIKGDIALTDRKANHSLISTKQADGAIRVLSYSPTNREFSGNEGAILKFAVVADDNFIGGDLRVENVVFSQRNMTGSVLENLSTQITNPNGVGTGVGNVSIESADVEYYNLQGVKVVNPGRGIYIKRSGGKTTKVVI